MGRSGLKKVKKSTKRGMRSYWVRADADQKLRKGLGILGSSVGAVVGFDGGRALLKSARKGQNPQTQVATYFAGGLLGHATGSFAGYKVGNAVGSFVARRVGSTKLKTAVGTFAALAGTAIHGKNTYEIGRDVGFARDFLRVRGSR